MHEFSTPADISAKDSTYTLYGQIVTKIGEDTQNDLIAGASIAHWKNMSVPYVQSFEEDIYKWKVKSGENSESSWGFTVWGVFNAYDGSIVLSHLNAAGEVNDWAISECIDIPAGDYDIEFFYSSELNHDDDKARQSFELMMGNNDIPESMTRKIVGYEEFAVPGPAYRKSVTRVHFDQSGSYYFGFHNYSTAGGSTFIDNFRITPVVAGRTLPYESDFNNKADELAPYNTNRKFTQWELLDEGDAKVYVVNYDEDAYQYNVAEGMLVSPKLQIDTDRSIEVNLEYACITDFEGISMVFYGSAVNDPDSFAPIQELPVTDKIVSHTVTIPKIDAPQGEYFIGVRSNQPISTKTTVSREPEDMYVLKLKSVKLDYGIGTGVGEVTAQTGNVSVSRNGNDIIVSLPESTASILVYDAGGYLLRNVSGTASQFTIPLYNFKDTAIVKVITAEGTSTAKVVM